MRAGASGCASSGVRLSLSTRSVGPVSPRNGGRVKGFDGVGGGGFGGFGEGVILIDPIPRSISLTAVLLSPSTAKMSLLVPSDAGRVKVDLGLVCGGGGGCVGIGVGVILIAPILSSIPSSSPPSFGALTDRRNASACCRGDTCSCSVEVGVIVGPLSASQPHSLPTHFPSSPPGQLRSATAKYPKSGWTQVARDRR